MSILLRTTAYQNNVEREIQHKQNMAYPKRQLFLSIWPISMELLVGGTGYSTLQVCINVTL